MLLRTANASAHAELVGTSPDPGARLGTAPGAVLLQFSETIESRLSRAVVSAPDGQRVTGAGSGTRISVPLATNAFGVYRVSWKVVSADDGHTTSGSFQFSVGTTPGAAGAGGSGTPGWQSSLFAAGRTIEYGALLLAAGLLLLRWRARRRSDLGWVKAAARSRLRLALLVAFVATFAVVVGEASVAEGSFSVDAVARFLGTGMSGGARLGLLACEALALAAVSLEAWPLVALFVVGGLGAVAAASHAAAIHPVALGVAVDAVHLVAAALWAGGILALLTLRPPGGWRGTEGPVLLERFSQIAIPAFSVSVAFGVVQGLQEVSGTISRLWSTSYGLVLLLKVAAIATMVPLSWAAWRRRLFRRAEGALAVGVVIIAAVLSVLPVPSTVAGATSSQGMSALPTAGELTLGGHAGQYLLGLSLRPGEPGRNLVTLYILPVEGSAANAKVRIRAGAVSLVPEACGTNCRRAQITLRGGESVRVSVDGPKGGEATFHLPSLPAPDGSRLLTMAQRRIHHLHTYRLFETLNGGLGVTIPANYAFEAPNRFESGVREQGTSSRTIWIGRTRYSRDHPGAKWVVERGGPSIPVPEFTWDYFRPFLDAHVVGGQTVDGVPTTIVAFFGSGGGSTPVWFRLWIDRGGLVRRAHMRADGHFMNDRYYDFGARFTIEPPVRGTR